jgi:hypothetical protein
VTQTKRAPEGAQLFQVESPPSHWMRVRVSRYNTVAAPRI